MQAEFFRYHALGNDYIVIDPNRTHINLTVDAVKLICHRNLGVGSDGILYGPIFEDGTIKLRILNPDGSEAEKSGNGIRIFSKYLVDSKYVDTQIFEISTLGGRVTVETLDKEANLIKVDMGTVTFRSDLIPVNGEPREVVDEKIKIGDDLYSVTCLSIGNPHCVIPVDEPSKKLALKLGPLVEHSELFPNRINMQLLEIIDRRNIKIEIWERGAGYTMASGSSSCAAASAAFRSGKVDRQLKVHMRGGIIDIEIKEDGHVYMTGIVSGIASGAFSKDLWDKMST